MDEQATTTGCPRCAALERRIAELEALVAELQSQLARLAKNSGNSSKPPSSDIVKSAAVTKNRRSRRKRGAQPGHPKHERPAFSPEDLDRLRDYQFERCPDCDGPLEVLEEPARVLQQIDVVAHPTKITEHRSRTCRCRKCRKEFTQPIPRPVRKAGLVGPRLTALIGYLKGACHCSFSTIRTFLKDVTGVTISRGQLRKVCGKVSRSLDPAYRDLLAALPEQERLNVDETGHKEYKQALWTWCFKAPLFTLFKIDPSRGSDVLLDVLGTEFRGVLGCDYFSAYRKYLRLNENVLVQFCLAHLIRDVRFLVEHPNSKNRAYGKRVLQALRDPFGLIHRRGQMSKTEFLGALEDQGFEVWTQATYRVPPTAEAQNLAERFHQHGREYLQFITTPGVEPTNNLAEQAIRFVVIDRRVTQGSRSPAGREWLERIWTAIATCTQHGRSVFDFLNQAVRAFFADQTAPTLFFGTS